MEATHDATGVSESLRLGARGLPRDFPGRHDRAAAIGLPLVRLRRSPIRRPKIGFVRKFRPALRASLLELPGGRIESPEKPVDAARRELDEETG